MEKILEAIDIDLSDYRQAGAKLMTSKYLKKLESANLTYEEKSIMANSYFDGVLDCLKIVR